LLGYRRKGTDRKEEKGERKKGGEMVFWQAGM